MTDDPLATEREKIERDKQKLEDDLARFNQAVEREQERERERYRQQARETEEERDRDRREFYERERRRAAEARRTERGPYVRKHEPAKRSVGPGPDLVLQDLGRLAYAWIRVGLETTMGINQAAGYLALSLNESIWGRQPEGSTSGNRETYGSSTRSTSSDYHDYGGKSEYSNRRDYQPRSSRTYGRSTEARPIFSDISIDLSNAVREAADALTQSAENFSRVIERERIRDDVENEFDEPLPPPPRPTVTEVDPPCARGPRNPGP